MSWMGRDRRRRQCVHDCTSALLRLETLRTALGVLLEVIDDLNGLEGALWELGALASPACSGRVRFAERWERGGEVVRDLERRLRHLAAVQRS